MGLFWVLTAGIGLLYYEWVRGPSQWVSRGPFLFGWKRGGREAFRGLIPGPDRACSGRARRTP